MILKAPDARIAAVSALEKLFLAADREQQAGIAHELYTVRANIKSQSESTYLINHHLRHNQNTVVIHDLRLALEDGRVAAIDHLLIHRSYRFYILESKHFSCGVKVDDQGAFMRWDDRRKAYEPTPSPIEKNILHSEILREVLASLGMDEPHIQSFVLIAPHAYIDRPQRFDTELVVSADQFLIALNENLENASFLGLLTGSVETPMSASISEIAQKLIAMHQPAHSNNENAGVLSEAASRLKVHDTQIQSR